MKELFSRLRNSHNLIFKTLVTLACISIIVYTLPKEAKFKYEFQKNKPWKHDELFAPFEYAIYKSEEKLELERQEINENNPPYFKLNSDISEDQIRKFDALFESYWKESDLSKPSGILKGVWGGSKHDKNKVEELKIRHYEKGRLILDEVFTKGIIKLDEVIEGKEDDFLITIEKEGISEDLELNEVYTLQSAYSFAKDEIDAAEGLDTDMLIQLMEEVLTQNVFYDQEITDKLLQAKLGDILETYGKVAKDEAIIERGDIVTEELYQKLSSLKIEYEKQAGDSSSYYIILAGQIILVSISVLVVIFFLTLFRRDIINESNKVSFVMIVYTLTVCMGSISSQFDSINIYVLPFCVLPIVIRTFYDVRLAMFIHIIASVLIGFLAPNGYEFVFLQLIAGVVAVFSLVSLRKRSQLLNTALVIFLTYSVIYLGIATIQEGNFEAINLMNFAWFAGSAALTLFSFPLIFIFEKSFGFLSDVSLMELSDTNSSLLRDLATKAPGTFQHTLQVANLAEKAALEVGANPLLVRTGALYHDIGKMQNPLFFIENQISGVNPHDELGYEESARVIINHVIHGIEMAKKAGLPELIIDFIRTHHGTTMTLYFYNSFKRDNPGAEIDETKFQYPGPIPYSKETAILMMADSVEAASRSLKKHDADTISSLVDNIINSQADQGQFVNADITFKDLGTIKKMFKKMLMNIYHVRIEYPK